MKNLEEKIKQKAKSCLKGLETRNNSVGPYSSENIETFVKDITGAMLKIVDAEVNIRLQEERHHPRPPKP